MSEVHGWNGRMLTLRAARTAMVFLAAALIGVVLAGCAAGGHDNQDSPIARKLTWFSYIKGDDLRANCMPGAPDRYRFVYNAVYVEQVRTYDIEPSPLSGHARVTARVTNKADLTEMAIDPRDPDLIGPWRAQKAVIDVPTPEMDRLKRAVLSDGFMTKAAPARAVTSIEFYWAVSACLDGQFRLNAWVWPNDDFNTAAFPKFLLGWDMTGVAVNQPRKTDEFSIYGSMQPDRGGEFANFFRLRFDES